MSIMTTTTTRTTFRSDKYPGSYIVYQATSDGEAVLSMCPGTSSTLVFDTELFKTADELLSFVRDFATLLDLAANDIEVSFKGS